MLGPVEDIQMEAALQVIVLAVVQGLTEFLPVSSSAHLILVPWSLGWQHLGLIFDVGLHVGTLLAILVYFRKDWISVLTELPRLFRRELAWSQSLILVLVIGTLPAAALGLVAGDFIESSMRTPRAIAVCLIGFALALWIAERRGAKARRLEETRVVDGVWIGLFQMLALAPGVSRSGITITGGMLRKFRSWDAARLSFLLSGPAIGGAGLVEARQAYREYLKGAQSLDPLMHQAHPFGLLLLGVVASAVVGVLCIRYFLRYLQVGSLVPFVVYRVIVGLAVLAAAG